MFFFIILCSHFIILLGNQPAYIHTHIVYLFVSLYRYICLSGQCQSVSLSILCPLLSFCHPGSCYLLKILNLSFPVSVPLFPLSSLRLSFPLSSVFISASIISLSFSLSLFSSHQVIFFISFPIFVLPLCLYHHICFLVPLLLFEIFQSLFPTFFSLPLNLHYLFPSLFPPLSPISPSPYTNKHASTHISCMSAHSNSYPHI